MKFSFECEWIKAVRRARGWPNYGMGNINSGLEEVCGNKLELSGPLVDSYLFEIRKQISTKLSHSKATSLASPVILFIPWPIFRHITILLWGYGGEVKFEVNKSKIISTLPAWNWSKRCFLQLGLRDKMFWERDISPENQVRKEKWNFRIKAGQLWLLALILLLFLILALRARKL